MRAPTFIRSSLAVTSLVVPLLAVPAYAAASPTALTVDCTDQDAFDASVGVVTWPGTENVVTALIDDTLTITNSGSADCAFGSGTALDSDSTAIANGAPRTVTVANSGSFTLTPSGGSPSTFYVDACSLDGSGIAVDPWLVGSRDDFLKVGVTSTSTGAQSCPLFGHYLQTEDIVLSSNTDAVPGIFTGVYDGDHHTLNLDNWNVTSSSGNAPFAVVRGGGVLKKLNLTGSMTLSASAYTAGSLVALVAPGGLVSEVASSVDISTDLNDVQVGGLTWGLENGGRIQYSKYSGTITWNPSAAQWSEFGGLVSQMRPGSTLSPWSDNPWSEIRDSYTSASIEWPTAAASRAIGGGLVGLSSGTQPLFVRSYSASEISSGAMVGGLSGRRTTAQDRSVSSFWLESATISKAVGSGTDYIDYDASDPYLPVAPGVSSAELATLSTFISQELSPGSGAPGGTELELGASNESSIAERDYRWAIESGNVSVFIPSYYEESGSDSAPVYFEIFNRDVFADTSAERTYQMQGTDLEGTASDYPVLGRVWEICGDTYPVLVWELENCGSSGGSPGAGSRDSDDDDSTNPYGMSDEEYAEFLASDLTYEQFVAARLAATGAPNAVLPVGFGVGLLLFLLGLTAFVARRRLV